MPVQEAPVPEPGAPMPLLAAADLQDHLMVASNDLDRLQRLLGDASDALLSHFHGAAGRMDALAGPDGRIDPAALQAVAGHIAGAITAMQFQDMASQLVTHTVTRLRHCADRLANDTFADDEDGAGVVTATPLRPNPVTQDEMDAGSIELF
jgi:hypothetical protein